MQHEIPHCLTQIAEVLHFFLLHFQLEWFFGPLRLRFRRVCPLALLLSPSSGTVGCVLGPMADNHTWVSANMHHQRNEVIHAFWKEARQPAAWGAGASPHPEFITCLAPSTVTTAGPGGKAPTTAAAPGIGSRPGSRGLGSSSDEDDCYHASASSSGVSPRRGYRQVSSLLCRWTFVCLRPHLSACHPGSSHLWLRTSVAPSPAFAPSIALCGCAWTTPSSGYTTTTKTGSTAGTSGCQVVQGKVSTTHPC